MLNLDTRQLAATCRIIAKHLTALADELDGQEVSAEVPEPVPGVARNVIQVRSDS